MLSVGKYTYTIHWWYGNGPKNRFPPNFRKHEPHSFKWIHWPALLCFWGDVSSLGGGNSNICWIFIPKIGENDTIWQAQHIFSNGLVQPPTSRIKSWWVSRKLTWQCKTKHFRKESLNQTQLESYPNIWGMFHPQLSWISPKCAVGSDSDWFFVPQAVPQLPKVVGKPQMIHSATPDLWVSWSPNKGKSENTNRTSQNIPPKLPELQWLR